MGVTWQLTIDCIDPTRLARFWGPALGYVPTPPPEGHRTWNDWYRSVGVPEDELDLSEDACDRIHDPDENGPRIWFQPVPERKSIKNRLHLDLYPGGGRGVPQAERMPRLREFVQDLIAAGAEIDHTSPQADDPDPVVGHWFTVMRDPEGNEFCVS